MSDISTDGGAHVGRNANAGRDFTGRDSTQSQTTVNNYPGERAGYNPENDSDRVMLQQIREALLGNPFNRNQRGLLADFSAMSSNIDTMGSRVSFLSASTAVIAIVLFVVVVIVSGIVIYLWPQRLVSEPPAASVEYPHKAAIDYKGGIGDYGVLPGNDDSQAEAGYRDADSGKEWAVGVAGLAGMFGEPFPVLVPNPEVEQIAQGQTQRNDIEQAFDVNFHRESIQQ